MMTMEKTDIIGNNTDESLGFVSFLIRKGYLKKISAPKVGCMAVCIDDSGEVYDAGVSHGCGELAFIHPTPRIKSHDDLHFFEVLSPHNIPRYFSEYQRSRQST
jgi:hypothetical protein